MSRVRPARFILQLQAIYGNDAVRTVRHVSSAGTKASALEWGRIKMMRKHPDAVEWQAKILQVIPA